MMKRFCALALLSVFLALPLGAQNLRSLTRSTAGTGTNDSALVLVSDSAFRTRAASTRDLFKRPAGTAALPSFSFAIDSTTGLYRNGAGQVGVSAAGAVTAVFSSSGITAASSSSFYTGDGVCTNPGFTFNAGSSLGMYKRGTTTDTLGFCTTSANSLNLTGGAAVKLFGGAGNMTIQAGTGNSRTMTLQTTGTGGVAVNTLLLGADSLVTSLGGIRVLGGTDGAGRITNNATTGLKLRGENGSAYDVEIANSAGASVILIPADSDTLAIANEIRALSLTAASGTPNSLCINATTKQFLENAALTCTVSSARFKKNIAPLTLSTAARVVSQLKPSTFAYREGGRRAVGLIAEQVDSVDTRLTTRNADGQLNSVNYEQVSIFLLSVVQDQQRKFAALCKSGVAAAC